jgi:integrase
MVVKRCGCKQPCRNDAHAWHIRLNLRRADAGTKGEAGAVSKYAFLLKPGAPLPTTKAAAKDLEALVRSWVLRGRPVTPVPGAAAAPATDAIDETPPVVTIAIAGQAYLDHYVLPELAGVSEPGIVRRFIRQLGSHPIADLTDRKVARAYLQTVQATSSGTNVNRHRSRWSHFLNWCRTEYGLTGDSPFYQRTVRPQGLKRQLENRRERRLRDGEEAALIRGCATLDDGGMMLGRYYCAVDALLRRGEMLALQNTQLRIERVKGAPTYYLVITAPTAKSRKAREVPVQSERLMKFLNERRFARYIFGQLDGSPISVSQFRTDWDKVMLASGLDAGEYRTTVVAERKRVKHRDWFLTKDSDLNWHDLRHEGASRMHDQGVPLREIQKLLGHSSLATTERYLNPKDAGIVESLRRVARELGI